MSPGSGSSRPRDPALLGFIKTNTPHWKVGWSDHCTVYFTPIIPDEPDRLLSTVVESSWKFNDGIAALYNGAMYTVVYNSAIRSIMDEFFGPAEEGMI